MEVRGGAQVSCSASGAASVPQVCPLDSRVLKTSCHSSQMARRRSERVGEVRDLSARVAAAWAVTQGISCWAGLGKGHVVDRDTQSSSAGCPHEPTCGWDSTVYKGRSCRPLTRSSPSILGGWQVRPILWMESLRFREVAWSGCPARAESSRDLNPGVPDCRSRRCSVPPGA